jgi:hypothetical protein
MAIVPVAFSVETAQDLEDRLNTLLAPLLTERIVGVVIDQVQQVPFFKQNLSVALTYETGAPALVFPFQFYKASEATEAQAITKLLEFISANPTYFFSPIYSVYRPQSPDPQQGVIVGLFYSQDPAAAGNWGYATSGGGPGGVAGGDLSGVYPNPLVSGFQGMPLAVGAPSSGQYYIYNSVSGEYELSQQYRYFVDSAAAVLAAPFIDGTYVVLYPGSPTSEAGTYQVTSNGGVAFPADYTLVSDATDTASEVAIVDAGGFYPSPKNVEVALQALGQGNITGPTGVLPVGTTVMDTVAVAASSGGDWVILIENGTLRYKTILSVTHDGGVAAVTESGGVPGAGVGVLPVTFDADILAGNLRILAIATLPGWSYRIRCLDLMVI